MKKIGFGIRNKFNTYLPRHRLVGFVVKSRIFSLCVLMDREDREIKGIWYNIWYNSIYMYYLHQNTSRGVVEIL